MYFSAKMPIMLPPADFWYLQWISPLYRMGVRNQTHRWPVKYILLRGTNYPSFVILLLLIILHIQLPLWSGHIVKIAYASYTIWEPCGCRSLRKKTCFGRILSWPHYCLLYYPVFFLPFVVYFKFFYVETSVNTLPSGNVKCLFRNLYADFHDEEIWQRYNIKSAYSPWI